MNASKPNPDTDTLDFNAARLLDERKLARFLKLRESVRAGFESGDAAELTPEMMDEIGSEAEEAVRRGEQPSPPVCT
jgi:hypothetical protein